MALIFCISCQNPINTNSEPASPARRVLTAFTEAKARKDGAAMKNSLSKGTLDTIEAVAANRNQTVDEYLLPGNTTPLNSPEVPEMRNDKEGENILTVEIRRHRNDKWRTLTFVKENGQWKMDLNRFLDELYPDLKTPDSSAPPPE